ncbi:unnamed protein product [Strongylus vulgaris]|uniref:SCP domain-containing protein n=1 Tax=Strongylus vulgaris TaxID=40348 RepID=A0A3P7IB61_STRVU|nr:unnamed protein product [Strongylus vulgaris]
MERSGASTSSGTRSFIESVAGIPLLVRITILVYIFFFIFIALGLPILCRTDMAKRCQGNISNRERFYILYHINRLRKDVARGKEKKASGGEYMPSAVAMYKLQWSCILQSEAAKRAANSKDFHHIVPQDGVYEYYEASTKSPYEVVEDAFMYSVRSKLTDPSSLPKAEKQLLTDTFTHVGCDLFKRGGGQKLICIFGTTLDQDTREEPYVVGEPGSKCTTKSLEPLMPLCIYTEKKRKSSSNK